MDSPLSLEDSFDKRPSSRNKFFNFGTSQRAMQSFTGLLGVSFGSYPFYHLSGD